MGISNLLKGLSPDVVIVGDQISRAWALIADELRNAVAQSSICRGLPSARIVASTLGGDTRLMGALSLVLASKFAFCANCVAFRNSDRFTNSPIEQTQAGIVVQPN